MVDPRGWLRAPEELPHLATVQAAVWSGRKLLIRYRASGQTISSNRLVDPFGLVSKAGIWYLIAAYLDEPRLYRISRLEAAAEREELAARPAELDLHALWESLRRKVEERGVGVLVTLRVRPERLEMMLRLIASQTIPSGGGIYPKPASDGWRLVTATFVSEGACAGTLLGFGADVEVLTPASLRRSFLDAAQSVVDLYSRIDSGAAGPVAQSG